MLDLQFSQLSDPGRARDHNEDFLGSVEPASPDQARGTGWLFALADGVGGQDKGEVASRTAVEAILAGFRSAPLNEPLLTLLPRLVQKANTQVFETGMATGKAGTRMATTIVACGLRYDRVVVSHVGDSRCYLLRRGHASLLTRDHTVVSEQVRLGVLSSREAAEAATSHVLTRSLGQEMFVSVETNEHHLLAGDILLLCSDGLHGAVPMSDMARIAGLSPHLDQAARELVELANARDGGDNISIQLIRILDVERVGMYRGRPYRLR